MMCPTFLFDFVGAIHEAPAGEQSSTLRRYINSANLVGTGVLVCPSTVKLYKLNVFGQSRTPVPTKSNYTAKL